MATPGDLPAGLPMTRGSRFTGAAPRSGTRCCGLFPLAVAIAWPLREPCSCEACPGCRMERVSSIAPLGKHTPYPPTFNLRVVNRDRSSDTQITFGDVSFVEPDVHASGRLVACRIRSQSDIWKCPVSGSTAENTRAMTPVTRQTGHVQTPSLSPDGSECLPVRQRRTRQPVGESYRRDQSQKITFERDGRHRQLPNGPRGDVILYIVDRELPRSGCSSYGRGAESSSSGRCWTWSPDGRWIY